jgi:hypothetical protein
MVFCEVCLSIVLFALVTCIYGESICERLIWIVGNHKDWRPCRKSIRSFNLVPEVGFPSRGHDQSRQSEHASSSKTVVRA